METTQTPTTQRIYPALRYRDARAAIAWLKSVLAFEERQVCEGEGGSIDHAELAINGNVIMLGSVKSGALDKSPLDLGGATGSFYVALDDATAVDALYARSKAGGAQITREPENTEYGSREFSLRDPEGYGWSFGTYRP